MSYYIGVDVGTGSARAALVDEQGAVVAESAYNTTSFRDAKDANIFEQSTDEIWSCVSKACQDVLKSSKVSNATVKGIGFDATCSLAVCNLEDGSPVPVNPSAWSGEHHSGGPEGEPVHDIILWADHRAYKEAKDINATGSMVLKFVGGTISLEMELPKILWLKRHMPAALFQQCMFFDLPDFLTYRATGDLARSNCSLACKCSYVPPGVEGSKGWNDELFQAIGLDDFVKNEFKQIGGTPGKSGLILTAGQPVGRGLSAKAAAELGLLEGTAVGSGVIDAYAGWIGTVAAPMEGQKYTSLDDSKYRLAAIAGTSTCHIVQSLEAVFVPGVWGPYKHAIFPGYWINEGGQSSTGQLLDFMIDTHPASEKLKALAKEQGTNHFSLLTELLDAMAKDKGVPFISALTQNVQLYPDLHGNRSPLADNEMRGMLIGMALDKNISDLALRYYATGEAIALQTRQIIDEMNQHGHEIRSIFMSGGLVKNRFLMSLIADVCNIPVQLPHSHSASVVIGSAMLGAAAAAEAKTAESGLTTQEEAETGSHGMKERLWDIMLNSHPLGLQVRMSKPGTTVKPSASNQELRLLKVKYEIFKECIVLQRKWRSVTAEAMASD
ncbi:BQ5605_C017g08369 [Microbotryum silenes-dioicae]|uniref:BQ5605_C017g08369 protein n=1 Tax=Microbotryum silenes-dioicae TaxID=796604 RepID=A0A2X0MG85_9BASI|nr:BQ5605_C017g08369 [Microbotryum silenes-dioicae]